jgi:hypothetical protein
VQDTGTLTDTDIFRVTVTDTGGITNVTVFVSGNQFCAGRTSGVERCFDITPAAALEATVRFYLSEVERNGLTLGDLLVFHYDGDWTEEPGPYTSGGTGDAQYVEAQNVDDFSLFALDKSGPATVYLPLVTKRWPPLPYTPVLNAISNADSDGNYTVSWSAALLANTYTLQEDDNASFSSPTTAYGPGTATSTAISGKPIGTYYYRVKATNSYGDSSWSNVESVTVLPPPDHYEGSSPSVSFDVTGQQVCNFDITVPFGSSSCRIRARSGVCFEIVNNSFRIELRYEQLGITDWIDGTFNSNHTNASGNYNVAICGNQMVSPPSTGTWQASKQ